MMGEKRIAIFLTLEALLVLLISIPLFIFKVESGSSTVMIVSVIFMWLPALVTFLTRKITHDKILLPLRPNIKGNWRKYIMAAYLPSTLIVLGAILYFVLFPKDLDLTFSFVKSLMTATGQEVVVPTITKGVLAIIAIGLIIVAPLFVCVVEYNALLGPKLSGIIGMIGFEVLAVLILIEISKEKISN